MTIRWEIECPGTYDVWVDCTGDIEVRVNGGYHGEDVERTFTADDMRNIATFADRRKAAYQAFVDTDYENEQAYFDLMPEDTPE